MKTLGLDFQLGHKDGWFLERRGNPLLKQFLYSTSQETLTHYYFNMFASSSFPFFLHMEKSLLSQADKQLIILPRPSKEGMSTFLGMPRSAPGPLSSCGSGLGGCLPKKPRLGLHRAQSLVPGCPHRHRSQRSTEHSQNQSRYLRKWRTPDWNPAIWGSIFF